MIWYTEGDKMGTRLQEAGHDVINFNTFMEIILPKINSEFLSVYSLAQRQGIVTSRGKNKKGLIGFDVPIDFTQYSSFAGEDKPIKIDPVKELLYIREKVQGLSENLDILKREVYGKNYIDLLQTGLEQEKEIIKIYQEINTYLNDELRTYSKEIRAQVREMLERGMVKGEESDLEKEVKLPDFTVFSSGKIDTIECKFEMLPRRAYTAIEILTFNELAKQNSGKLYLTIPHPDLKEKYPELSIPFRIGRKIKDYLDYLRNSGCEIIFFSIEKPSKIEYHNYREVIK